MAAGMEGEVIVQFMIDDEGYVREPRVLRRRNIRPGGSAACTRYAEMDDGTNRLEVLSGGKNSGDKVRQVKI